MLFELTLVCGFFISLIMHFFHFPGAGVLMTLSLLLLSSMYFVKYIILSSREKNWRFLFYGAALTMCAVGTLFRYMHWPNGEVFSAIGALLGIGVLGLVFMHRDTFSEATGGFRILGFRLAVAALICGSLWAIPESTLIAFQYRDAPEYGKLLIEYRKNPTPENEAALRAYEAAKWGTQQDANED